MFSSIFNASSRYFFSFSVRSLVPQRPSIRGRRRGQHQMMLLAQAMVQVALGIIKSRSHLMVPIPRATRISHTWPDLDSFSSCNFLHGQVRLFHGFCHLCLGHGGHLGQSFPTHRTSCQTPCPRHTILCGRLESFITRWRSSERAVLGIFIQ